MVSAKFVFRACLLVDLAVSFTEGLENMFAYARWSLCSLIEVFLGKLFPILRILSQHDSILVFGWFNICLVHSLWRVQLKNLQRLLFQSSVVWLFSVWLSVPLNLDPRLYIILYIVSLNVCNSTSCHHAMWSDHLHYWARPRTIGCQGFSFLLLVGFHWDNQAVFKWLSSCVLFRAALIGMFPWQRIKCNRHKKAIISLLPATDNSWWNCFENILTIMIMDLEANHLVRLCSILAMMIISLLPAIPQTKDLVIWYTIPLGCYQM